MSQQAAEGCLLNHRFTSTGQHDTHDGRHPSKSLCTASSCNQTLKELLIPNAAFCCHVVGVCRAFTFSLEHL